MIKDEQERAQRFLVEFKNLEFQLARITRNDQEFSSVSNNLKIASQRNPFVRKNVKRIRLFIDLRNFLSHQDHGGYGPQHLAIPREELITDLSKIVERLANPLLTVKHYGCEINEFSLGDKISSALSELHAHSFSQAFVRTEDGLTLLTANTVLRWIASNQEIGLVDLEATIADVLQHVEFKEELLVKPKNITVDETLELFLGNEWPHLVAVAITDNGKPTGKVLGVITVSDLASLAEIDKAGNL